MPHRICLVNDMEITKREIIASISIIALMLIIGFVISNQISEYQMDKNEIYNKAVKIESSELFRYGMDTNVGNAFVYGELKAVDTVTYPEIDGEYMYIEKIKERYTKHTRTKTYKDSNGKTKTKTETYYSWDYAGSEDLSCNEVSFCDVTFSSYKFCLPDANYIDTIKESSKVRYKYYGVATSYTGTIFTELRDKTISNNSLFYANMGINSTLEYITTSQNVFLIAFWVIWIVIIIGAVVLFYKAENRWLE